MRDDYSYDDGRYVDNYEQDPARGPLVPLPPPSLATPAPPVHITPEPPLPPPSPSRLNGRDDRNTVVPRSNLQPHFRPYVPPYAGFERSAPPQPVTSHRHRSNNVNRANVDTKPARPTPAPWDYVESDSPDGSRSVSHEPPSNSRYTIAEPPRPTQPPVISSDNEDYGGHYDVLERDVYHNNNDQDVRYRDQPPPAPPVS